MDEKLNKLINKNKSKYSVLMNYYGYANKSAYKMLNEYIITNNIDTSHWIEPKKYCLNCGKEIIKSKKFCNSSCAATYNNKKRGRRSNKTKLKISNSLIKTIKKNKLNVVNTKIARTRVCVVCKKEFEIPSRKYKGYSNRKTCSYNCMCKLLSNNINKRIKNGNHNGWNNRKIISYPEQFFIKVLKNNNIKYRHNYPIKQKDLGIDSHYNYFLDFFLSSKNIDLEIDGSQHSKRKEADRKRDNLLTNYGIKVYRIKWKNINTDNGKAYIKNEIDKFLKYYNSSDFSD